MHQRAEIALYSAECVTLIGVLENLRVMDHATAMRHRGFLRSLARLGGHLISATGEVSLPQEARECYVQERARLLSAVHDSLRLQHQAVDRQETFAEPQVLPSIREWTAHCRDLIRAQTTETLPIYLSLGLLYRTEQIAVSANERGADGGQNRFSREIQFLTHQAGLKFETTLVRGNEASRR